MALRGLTVSYGSRPVLWDVDARFPAGALSAIIGPNGAGIVLTPRSQAPWDSLPPAASRSP